MLANYTALCGLHRTACAVSIEKEHNFYTRGQAYTQQQKQNDNLNKKQHDDPNRKQHDDFNQNLHNDHSHWCSHIMMYHLVYAEGSKKQHDD